MIYFLDNSLQLQKIVTSKNVISAIHEHELNGLIRADVELDLSYANKFLVLGIDHVGYYYKDEFYLHKIQRLEYDHVNETVTVVLRHIFFEDMIFGKLIQDVRPQEQDALTVSRQTIDANTRWQTIMTDVTGRLSTNFYWQVPYEVIEFMTENYRIEYQPKILFDGEKINGFQLHLANKIGEDKNIRIPYGSRVLELKYEEDYSEIITKLVVHGKGEEVGDGYGRRIDISNVNFNRNGVKSPVGSLYLEDESITNKYGNDDQTPREGREVFEDIEDPNELAEAGYQHYLQVSRPQVLYTADVADIGDVGIGDSVIIVRREYDVYFNARIHKLSVDLLYPEDAQVELGDYQHFKESKVQRKARERDKQFKRETSDHIQRLKEEFDDRFDGETEQMWEEYEQALIDVHAQIEADRENMTNLIEGTRSEFTDNLYTEISQAKDFAEQQAQAKAEAVRTDLETVTSGHQQMLDTLNDNVINIDDFLGDSRSVTLDERFQNVTTNFENRIRNINVNTYNMLQGTRFDEPNKLNLTIGGVSIQTYGDVNSIRVRDDTGFVSRFAFTEPVKLEPNTNYYLTIEYRTFSVPEIDYLAIQTSSGYVRLYDADTGANGYENLVKDGAFNKATTRIRLDEMVQGVLHIGTRPGGEVNGAWVDVRQPYLTNTSNREWLPHPNDATQSIEQVTRRITELEDGYSDFITKTQYDLETGSLNQYIKSVEQTAEGNQMTLQRVEDWQATTGQSVLETVDAYERKLWLNDVANIGANLVATSSNAWEDGSYWSTGNTNNTLPENIRLKKEFAVSTYRDVNYTFTCDSWESSNIRSWMLVNYDTVSGESKTIDIPRGQSRTILTIGNRIVLTAYPIREDGANISVSGFESKPKSSINIKLEQGGTATPMLNALSRIEQLADSVTIQVQELDGEYLTQSDIQVKAGYVQLGSQRLGDDQFASIFRVSPNSIQAITDRMILNGDLYVDGDITALAVDAIEGNFAKLFANQLTSNVITADHISVGTELVDKLFASSARIDKLITKSHFTTNVKAMSIDAVQADISSINSKIMTTNILKSEWIDVDNAIIERIISRKFFSDNATIKAANIRDLTATDIKGGVLSSLNNSMKFNLITNHLEFNRNATIDFYSKNNMFRMIYPSSTRDNRNVIAGFGTTEASNGSNLAYFGGGHYDIDGTIKANDTGFAGLRVGGGSNDSRLTGTNVEIGSGNASNDMYFKFDFEDSGSSRYARFRPPTSADNYVLGGSNTPFHSIYSWRINRLRFTNLSGNTEIRYDNGGTNGAGFRFTETDVYFVRGGLFSIKQAIDRAESAYDSINASNGLKEQIRSLANRVTALER